MMIQKTIDGRHRLHLLYFNMDTHNLFTLVWLALGIIFAMGWSIQSGTESVSFIEVLQSFVGYDLGADKEFAIYDNRMPRIIMAGLVGCCVAMVGAILQSLMRNPLADPGLLGLSQGSILTIMVTMFYFPNLPHIYYPWFALLGGLAVGFLLLFLVGKHNQGGIAILLMGIALETVLSSISSIMILHFDVTRSYNIAQWAQGSLFYSSWDYVLEFMVWFTLALAGLIFLCKPLRVYDLGDQMALSLGERITVSKPILLIFTVLITAASVSAVGPMAFLGVLCPHLVDFVTKASGRSRVFLSGMVGAFVLIIADYITRTNLTYLYMPIGMTIIMVGVPLFIVTLRLRYLQIARSQ